MKKILLTPILCMILSAPAFAQSEPGYLTDGSGNVVKSGFGLCWNSSATKIPNVDCGDVGTEQPKAVVAELPQPQLIPVMPERKVESVGIVLNSSLLFKFDSSQLSTVGEEMLNKEVVSLNPTSVEIIGHTDPIGTQQYNLRLSKERAEAVRSYLVSKGINEGSITASGMGETQLACEEQNPNKFSDCSEKNRRVEIKASTYK